jgi:hypothetical protein
MVEFTSEPQKKLNSIRLVIALAVLIILAAGALLFVHYQSGRRSASGNAEVVVPGVLRAGDTNFEYYKTRILIENVKATLGVSFNNSRIAIVTGTIVNDGDRKLEALELHITLLRFARVRAIAASR